MKDRMFDLSDPPAEDEMSLENFRPPAPEDSQNFEEIDKSVAFMNEGLAGAVFGDDSMESIKRDLERRKTEGKLELSDTSTTRFNNLFTKKNDALNVSNESGPEFQLPRGSVKEKMARPKKGNSIQAIPEEEAEDERRPQSAFKRQESAPKKPEKPATPATPAERNASRESKSGKLEKKDSGKRSTKETPKASSKGTPKERSPKKES